MRNKSEQDLLNSKFAKSIQDFLRKVTLALDLKSKEAEELFSAATKKVEDSIKASNKFLNKEIEMSKQSILEVAKISEIELESNNGCLIKYNEEIEGMKKTFTDKIKSCTEKTVLELETVRSRYDENLDEVRKLKKSTTRALKECLSKKDNVKVCVEAENKNAHEKYKNLLEKLKLSSNNSIESIDEVLKSANVCFKTAESEVTKILPEMVKNTEICIKGSKEYKNDSQKVTVNISTNNENSKKEKLECLREAQKDVLNTVNLVLHEIETSEKLTETIKKSNKRNPMVQELLSHIHKLFQGTKQVIQKCTEKDLNNGTQDDTLKCLKNIFDSMKSNKLELIKKIETLQEDKIKKKREIEKALEWISSTEVKLQKLREIFETCTKSEKK